MKILKYSLILLCFCFAQNSYGQEVIYGKAPQLDKNGNVKADKVQYSKLPANPNPNKPVQASTLTPGSKQAQNQKAGIVTPKPQNQNRSGVSAAKTNKPYMGKIPDFSKATPPAAPRTGIPKNKAAKPYMGKVPSAPTTKPGFGQWPPPPVAPRTNVPGKAAKPYMGKVPSAPTTKPGFGQEPPPPVAPRTGIPNDKAAKPYMGKVPSAPTTKPGFGQGPPPPVAPRTNVPGKAPVAKKPGAPVGGVYGPLPKLNNTQKANSSKPAPPKAQPYKGPGAANSALKLGQKTMQKAGVKSSKGKTKAKPKSGTKTRKRF